jgi:mono/diheme cytochrome c family protein
MRKKTPCRALTLVAIVIGILLASNISFALAEHEKPCVPNGGKWNYAPLARVPEKAHAMRNPLEDDPDAVAAGGKLFEQYCAECHGKQAEGGSRGPSLLCSEVQEATPGALFWVLTNGVVRRGMPVWSKLPEPQRWQIVEFLRSLNTSRSLQTSLTSHGDL